VKLREPAFGKERIDNTFEEAKEDLHRPYQPFEALKASATRAEVACLCLATGGCEVFSVNANPLKHYSFLS